ncbi:MAG: hypothetical protein ACLTSX_09460 [Collinsella sp.]
MKAKDLRNSILQMAVEGKARAAGPADEPAKRAPGAHPREALSEELVAEKR